MYVLIKDVQYDETDSFKCQLIWKHLTIICKDILYTIRTFGVKVQTTIH